uniref:non-specific serine/threonine protein kinase n=1 Tax=Ananas comosus var. bracteatus TaxID=296719 RepID=A0A6V7NHY3_ANACO|nr:unnamed protein product [Ananas comosus var. bracteatus]
MALLLSFLLLLLFHPTSSSPSPAPAPAPGPAPGPTGTDSDASTTTTCPMDMSYVSTFPWDHSPCEPAASAHNLTACCQTLLSVFGIAFAERLHSTGLFNLPSAASSAACLSLFSFRLTSPPLSLSPSLIPSCFPSPLPFVASPDFCAGIVNTSGWSAALRSSDSATAAGEHLAAACGGDIASLMSCGTCYYAATEVSSVLTALDGNTSHATPCFYLTVLYAAGVVNARGPFYPTTANCTFGLALSSPSPSPNPNPNPNPSRSRSTAAVAAISAAAAALALALAAAALTLLLWRSRRRKKNSSCCKALANDPDPISPHPRPNTGSIAFDIRDLDKATDRFSPRNLIGRGGFGVVYRGALPDGSLVAVKKVLDPQLDDGSGCGVAGDDEFHNEVEIISNLRHRNLVPLRGYCIAHGDLFLVYDFMPNGSLDQHIFPSSSHPAPKTLTWPERRGIILDVAKGLAYLHYGVKPAIFHRDIKATNILLDREMRARVADFGLARRSRDGESHLTTRVAGTRGYLAPEYALYGQLTEKSDVYSFGVLVLEVMTGRRALDMAAAAVPGSAVLVTDWAWALVRAGRAEHALDPPLLAIGSSSGGSGAGNPKGIMVRFVLVGILCAHAMVALRPTIADALRMLEGDVEVPDVPDRPTPLGFHGLIYGDGSRADTFAASPALSGPCLDAGDMLR